MAGREKWHPSTAAGFPDDWRERAAAREAAKEALRARPLTCPTPTKRAYLTESEAEQYHDRLRRHGKDLRRKSLEVYKCQCGVYHLGNNRFAKEGTR